MNVGECIWVMVGYEKRMLEYGWHMDEIWVDMERA